MSRIGKRPIKIEEGVSIEITPSFIVAKKDQNEMKLKLPEGISAKQSNGEVLVSRKDDSIALRAQHGLCARLIQNMIVGVSRSFTKELEFKGTGYRVNIEGNELMMNMGYSHPIKLSIPDGIEAVVKKNLITISGIDRSKVGEFAAKVRNVRLPEVYKGKGIRYKEEQIKRKAGKKAATA